MKHTDVTSLSPGVTVFSFANLPVSLGQGTDTN